MSDHRLDIEINIATGVISGASTAEKALGNVKTAAEDAGRSIDSLNSAVSRANTAALPDMSSPVDAAQTSSADATIDAMREKFKQLNEQIASSRKGIDGINTGIGKTGATAGRALPNIVAIATKLSAASAGWAIGSAVGDSIYKNIVTPIWDAVDKYRALHDEAGKAYEKQKDLNREILSLRSQKFTEVVAEIAGVTTSLVETAKQAEATRKALGTLRDAEADLDKAKVKYAETTGKITAIEAKAFTENIEYAQEMNRLMADLDKQNAKLADMYSREGPDSAEYRDQQAVTQAAWTRVQGGEITKATSNVELGRESKKVIQDLEAAIKSQAAKVIEARDAVGPAGRSGSNTALQSALADVQKQEQLLSEMNSQLSRMQSTLGGYVQTFETTVESAGQDAGAALGSAGTTIKTAGTEFVAATDAVKKDVETAGQAATAAVSGSTGSVVASIEQMGHDISGAVGIMGTKIVSTTQALLAKVNSLSAEIQSVGAVANAARVESSLNSSQIKNMR